MDRHDVDFASISEKIDISPAHGKLMFHVFGVMVAFERDRIRQRTINGLAGARGGQEEGAGSPARAQYGKT